MGSKSNIQPKIDSARKIARRLGVFRSKALVEAGFPREYLRRLLDEGQIRQVGRGLYTASDFNGDHNQALLEATTRFPKGIVCLMSALQFYEIGTQSPFEVWLAIPAGLNIPRTSEKLAVRFCRFSQATHAFGVERHKVPGGIVPVFTPAKTVADCFKYRNKFGLDVAVEALKDGWREKKFTLTEIKEAAIACRVAKVIQPYLEMLV